MCFAVYTPVLRFFERVESKRDGKRWIFRRSEVFHRRPVGIIRRLFEPMTLSSGARLGHDDVTTLIGEGGMGQVWQVAVLQHWVEELNGRVPAN